MSRRPKAMYPMHNLPQTQRSLLQVHWERKNGLIEEPLFQLIKAKLEARVKKFKSRKNV